MFITILEYAFEKLNWDDRGRYKYRWSKIIHLRFEDNIVLTSDNLRETKLMLPELQSPSNRVGIKINFSKTKFMTNLIPKNLIKIENKCAQIVEKYIYSGQERNEKSV